jgi:hypothetical protein
MPFAQVSLYFKQQYLGLTQFVMVGTSVKFALLSTFNMTDANVAKVVFFHIAHSSFSFAPVIFSIALLLQPIYYLENKCIGHLHGFYAHICGGVMTEFISIQHALVPTPKPVALFCDKSYMTDIQKSEGILFC